MEVWTAYEAHRLGLNVGRTPSLDGVQPLGGNAQRVADGNPDSARPHIERQHAPAKGRELEGIDGRLRHGSQL